MSKFRTEENDPTLLSSKAAIRQNGMKTQLDWIRRQLEYADFSEKYQLRYDLKRGEIYEFDWGLNVNAEFSNRHFGVVMVDSDEQNPLVTVCPLKSNHNGINPKSDVDLGVIPELKTGNSTIAVVNQVRTIDKLRLYTGRVIGRGKYHQLRDSFVEQEDTVIRLNEFKFKKLFEAYKSYLLNELGKDTMMVY